MLTVIFARLIRGVCLSDLFLRTVFDQLIFDDPDFRLLFTQNGLTGLIRLTCRSKPARPEGEGGGRHAREKTKA